MPPPFSFKVVVSFLLARRLLFGAQLRPQVEDVAFPLRVRFLANDSSLDHSRWYPSSPWTRTLCKTVVINTRAISPASEQPFTRSSSSRLYGPG